MFLRESSTLGQFTPSYSSKVQTMLIMLSSIPSDFFVYQNPTNKLAMHL